MRAKLPRLPRRTPDALTLAAGSPRLQEAVRRSRKLVRRRAATAAVASAVPLPGLDWAVDAAMLTQLLPEINRQFGLTPEQVSRLSGQDQAQVHKIASMAGSVLVGRNVTKNLALRFARTVGTRMTVVQASKYVPLAGQVVAGVLGYSILSFLAEQHIRDCVRVASAVPALAAAPTPALLIEDDATPAAL